MNNELLPCPFCGEPASHGNGFSPCESIVYAWCSNNDCQLHLIDDYGFTPELWNTRAKAAPAELGYRDSVIDALRAENAVLKTAYEETEKTLMSLYNLILPKLRAENAELVAALVDAQKIINYHGWSTNEQPAYDAIDAALAKHRGDK